MLRISHAVESDFPAICEMLKELARQHAAYDAARYVLPPDIIGVYQPWLKRSIDGKEVLAVVATQTENDRNGVVGYLVAEAIAAQGEYWSPAHVYIHDLFVMPEGRALGTGEKLVEFAASWAKSQGLCQLRGLVAAHNGQAERFFARVGFRPTAAEFTRDL